MTRSPLFLAALASSAVPGLDPVTVEGVPGEPGDLFEIAYVQDSQDRRWVVKAPCTAAAGAMLDDISALSGLLGRRLDVAMPMVRGFAPVPEGRAAVYLRVPGRPLDFAALAPGPLTVEVGRTLAHIHNVEHLLFEEAGRPTYDAEAHRRRQLSAARPRRRHRARADRPAHPLGARARGRLAVALRPERGPRHIHRAERPRVVRRRQRLVDRPRPRGPGVGGEPRRRPGRRLRRARQRRSAGDARRRPRGLRRVPDRTPRRPPRAPRPPRRRDDAPARPCSTPSPPDSSTSSSAPPSELRALDARVEADDRRHAVEDAERSERTRAGPRAARRPCSTPTTPSVPERPSPSGTRPSRTSPSRCSARPRPSR